MTWIRRLAVLVLLVLVAGATPAQARSFQILSMEVTAVVNPDGSMDVTERLDYDFDGEFNGGTRTIPDGGSDYSIVDFAVAEGGETRDLAPGFDDPDFGREVRWFGSGDHSKVSGRHSYDLTYRVLDAAEVFPDVGVLNWFFVGPDFPRMSAVSVDITMPGDGTDLRAFAHGALNGIVTPEDNVVHLRITDNDANSPIEARITVPAADFTGVTPSGAPALDGILAEEAQLAATANAARDGAAADYAAEVGKGLEPACDDASSSALDAACARLQGLLDDAGDPSNGEPLGADDADRYFAILRVRREIQDEADRIEAERLKGIGDIAVPVATAVAAGAWYLLFLKVGKEREKPADIGDYWRDIPEESPAVVAAVDSFGAVGQGAFAQTVLDLAQRGWLTITEEGDDHRFTRSQQTEDEKPLRDYESKVLWRLFPDGQPTITQDQLVSQAKADRTGSAEWMSSFKAMVTADYESKQYQEKHGCGPWLLHFALVGVLALCCVVGLGTGSLIGLAVAVPTTIVIFVCGGFLRRRTEVGNRKHAEVKGLKHFLKDFSLVQDVPVGHLALYEQYLVYAVALGVAEKLVAGLRMHFPELANSNSGFAPWYIGAGMGSTMGSGGGLDKLASIGNIDSFATSFSRATASAFSPPSSSSGGGGGFSGGGGGFSGGGGGGGAGAW